MSRIELPNEWERRMVEFRSSGQSASAWCASSGINLQRFQYWQRKFAKTRSAKPTPPSVQWLPVQLVDAVSVKDPEIPTPATIVKEPPSTLVAFLR